MDIGFYIADLLQNQDDVSLPGLGTFTKERVAGSYDRMTNSFSPPSYHVSFNKNLADFSSLSKYISIKKNLSQSSAEYFVKKFTSALFDLLQTSGTAEVKPLGIIRQKDEILTFEAFADFEIPGKFYGFKSITDLKNVFAPPVGEIEVPASDNTIAQPNDTIIPPVKAGSIEDFITSQGDEEIEEEEEYLEETQSNRALLIVLGVFLLAITAAGLLYLFNPTARNMVDSLLPSSVPAISIAPAPETIQNASPTVTADSLNTIPQTITPDNALVDSSTNPASAVKTAEPVETTTIEIIGAAFGKRHEAENYIKAMNAKGQQAKILEDMPGPLIKVSLGSFPDVESSEKELSRIRKDINKQAWPVKYKSKKTK